MSIRTITNKQQITAKYGTIADQLSTNTYADVGDIIDVAMLKTKHFSFTAATNNLKVNVLGSFDGGATFDQTLEADIAVSTSAAVAKTYTDPYSHIKVQVKAAAGGAQGTLSTKFFGSWL
jgi:hypothetical protein